MVVVGGVDVPVPTYHNRVVIFSCEAHLSVRLWVGGSVT